MIKKFLLRGLSGIGIGATIGLIILFIISAVNGDGKVALAPPELLASFPTELGAVVFEFALCGVLGFVFAAISVVFEIEQWSMAKQTLIHFVVMLCTILPIAWLNYWIPHTWPAVLLFIAIFIGYYIIIWLTQYRFWRKRIKEVNQKLAK